MAPLRRDALLAQLLHEGNGQNGEATDNESCQEQVNGDAHSPALALAHSLAGWCAMDASRIVADISDDRGHRLWGPHDR
jgi:hypothetical protein